MSNKRLTLSITLMLIVGLISLMGCSENSVLAPNEEIANAPAIAQGIPGDQINWISWKPEISEQLKALNKAGFARERIAYDVGGTVGGDDTFGNSVYIPAYALSKDQWISVAMACMDGKNPCSAEVEFGPSQSFSIDVAITLSYGELDFQGSPNLLKVYWIDEDTGLWVELDDAELDKSNKTISANVGHFSRYAWAL